MITELPPIRPGDRSSSVPYDGSKAGFFAAVIDFLAEAGPEVTSISFVFDGELHNVTAEAARGMALQ